MTDSFTFYLLLSSILLLAAAGLHDAVARTIPNWIPASLTAIGLILRIQQGNILAGLGVFIFLLIAFGFLWIRGFIGGGDMKLIPAVALVLPPSAALNFVLYVSLAGGVLALSYLALSFVVRRPKPGPRHGLPARLWKAEAWRMHRRGPLPYALAIVGGALPFFINTFSR